MEKLEIHICTKIKCTNRTVEVKVRTDDAGPGVYNGLEPLTAARQLRDVAEVREVTCTSSCPVGPRVDLMKEAKRVRYIKRRRPTGRPDFVKWLSIDSIENEI